MAAQHHAQGRPGHRISWQRFPPDFAFCGERRGDTLKRPTVGILVTEFLGWERFWLQFREALRGLGYVEGQNIRFEFRSDEGDRSRLPALAAELVQLKVDVIVGWVTPAAVAAKQATRAIPIVCGTCGDPIGTGLIASLARPGGNVTGVSGVGAELAGKLVQQDPRSRANT